MNKLLFFAIGLGLLYLTKTSIAGKRGFCKRLEQKVDHLTELFQNCSNKDCPTSSGPPASCKEVYEKTGSRENKAYQLQMDTGKVLVYCHMTDNDLGACGGGGWTLVMKIDGNKRTFHYNSPYWTDKNGFSTPEGITGFDSQETKLPTYWNTPFSKICLGMKVPGQNNTRFLMIEKQASSLQSLITDGMFRPTSLGLDAWKSLIGSQASLQVNCHREGFNAASDSPSFNRARIGIIGNDQDACVTHDSRLGFGLAGITGDSTSCGNEAIFNGDNGEQHIKAMGYIFVQ